MKKLKILLLIPLVLFTTRLHGDIIIVEPKPAKIYVRIINLNKFPDIAVIGLSDCLAFSKSNKAYRIKNNTSLKVNKACPLALYIMKMDYFKQIDLDNINWGKDKNVQKLNLTVKVESFITSEYNSLDIDFNLACKNKTIYYLYKTKMTYKYQDERPASVKNFEDDVVDPFKPISVSTGYAPR